MGENINNKRYPARTPLFLKPDTHSDTHASGPANSCMIFVGKKKGFYLLWVHS